MPIRNVGSRSVGKLINAFRNRDVIGLQKITSAIYTNRKLAIEATGGSAGSGNGVTPGDGFRYFVFTTPGANTWTVTKGESDSVEYLVVGGGGGGGTQGPGAGGGGAGGLLTNWTPGSYTGSPTRNIGNVFPVEPGSYTMTIGDGGSGGGPPAYPLSPDLRAGQNGQASSIALGGTTIVESYGGGGGTTSNGQGGNGGRAQGYPGPSQQGFPGGVYAGPTPGGSGGGGSASVGGAGGAGVGGSGDGFGGIPPSYGTPGPNSNYRYFAGGGGGANRAGGAGGAGGDGGGGNGGGPGASVAGVVNTGGGGGSGSDPTPNTYGRPGGSGIVVIKVAESY